MILKPTTDSGLVARRAIAYAAVVLGCLAVAPWVDRLRWVGNVYIHSLHEMAAVMLALGVAVISLVRFHSRKSDTYLLIGSAFLGVAFLDGYHAVQASDLVTTGPPWSWLASRLFL
ncbi:MAG TPA: MASE3 domain-containing protein, partial [Thermoanaerobaculia bacterium]|nr:MASE3 domain-containing protein [Thermoanaerobaculia bacterium]